MNELGKLSKSGMDLAPVKAGKLIREMREEKGFNQCFDIDNKMDHKTGDKLYQLVISLLREIQKEPEGNNYWKEPLAELEFDSSKPVWNDDGFRMLNILAYITKSMEEMEIPEMNDDLKNYLGTEYMKQLWKESKANERIYQGQGSTVFVGSLFQWMDK